MEGIGSAVRRHGEMAMLGLLLYLERMGRMDLM